jgi:hypothetical protein
MGGVVLYLRTVLNNEEKKFDAARRLAQGI